MSQSEQEFLNVLYWVIAGEVLLIAALPGLWGVGMVVGMLWRRRR